MSSLSQYAVVCSIGQGSCGSVDLVRCLADRKLFALKKVQLVNTKKTRTQDAVIREAKILSELKHLHIVAFHESFFDQDRKYLYIVQDYCDSGTLEDKICEARNHGTNFPEKIVMHWFLQVTMAVRYIHLKRVLHRDIKTANVFLNKSATVCKLGDFGIAKNLENSIDVANTCVGTPCYLAPEMCQDIPYSSKADVWAVGCLLYELLAMKPAFDANNLVSLFYKIVKGDHEKLPDCYSDEIKNLVSILLCKNPEDRPSAGAILQLAHVKAELLSYLEEKEHILKTRIVNKSITARPYSTPTIRSQYSADGTSPSCPGSGISDKLRILSCRPILMTHENKLSGDISNRCGRVSTIPEEDGDEIKTKKLHTVSNVGIAEIGETQEPPADPIVETSSCKPEILDSPPKEPPSLKNSCNDLDQSTIPCKQPSDCHSTSPKRTTSKRCESETGNSSLNHVGKDARCLDTSVSSLPELTRTAGKSNCSTNPAAVASRSRKLPPISCVTPTPGGNATSSRPKKPHNQQHHQHQQPHHQQSQHQQPYQPPHNQPPHHQPPHHQPSQVQPQSYSQHPTQYQPQPLSQHQQQYTGCNQTPEVVFPPMVTHRNQGHITLEITNSRAPRKLHKNAANLQTNINNQAKVTSAEYSTEPQRSGRKRSTGSKSRPLYRPDTGRSTITSIGYDSSFVGGVASDYSDDFDDSTSETSTGDEEIPEELTEYRNTNRSISFTYDIGEIEEDLPDDGEGKDDDKYVDEELNEVVSVAKQVCNESNLDLKDDILFDSSEGHHNSFAKRMVKFNRINAGL